MLDLRDTTQRAARTSSRSAPLAQGLREPGATSSSLPPRTTGGSDKPATGCARRFRFEPTKQSSRPWDRDLTVRSGGSIDPAAAGPNKSSAGCGRLDPGQPPFQPASVALAAATDDRAAPGQPGAIRSPSSRRRCFAGFASSAKGSSTPRRTTASPTRPTRCSPCSPSATGSSTIASALPT
jgi:hypothetical protein